jgi:ribonuclease E
VPAPEAASKPVEPPKPVAAAAPEPAAPKPAAPVKPVATPFAAPPQKAAPAPASGGFFAWLGSLFGGNK